MIQIFKQTLFKKTSQIRVVNNIKFNFSKNISRYFQYIYKHQLLFSPVDV
jgi:hypothetical protein